jgi:hypothetical protein
MSKHTIIKNISLVTYESPIEFIGDDGTVTIIKSQPEKREIYVSPENKYEEEFNLETVIQLPVMINEPINVEDELHNEIPRYNNYVGTQRKIKYKKNIDATEFKDILFNDNLTAFHFEDYEKVEQYLDELDDEKMRVRLRFDDVLIGNKNAVLISEKVFTKLENGKVSYYYDQTKPSVIQYKNSTFIPINNNFFMRTFHNELSDNKNKEQHLKCYHYFNLNIIVYIHVNFNQDKITPAIVITDENNQPTEIHYFYKNKYVPAALIDQIKPNLLNEAFNEVSYFDQRDIDFLDMAMFK